MRRGQIVAAAGIVLALLVVPAPMLPPHRIAETLQAVTGLQWAGAYLIAALGLQASFYGALGVLAGAAVDRAPTGRRRILGIVIVPVAVVAAAVLIRSAKLGHVPMLGNALVPAAACLAGTALGLGFAYRGWRGTAAIAAIVLAAALWGMFASAPGALQAATKAHLERLVASAPALPAVEARFGALWRAAFMPLAVGASTDGAVRDNRAAILALGIALGHERLARYAGLERGSELVRKAALLGTGTTLRGREDLSRHFAVSAALAVLEHPLLSDTAGLLKEELDALTHGSGFSFGDLAADRAGVRFALLATHSEASALAMRRRMRDGFAIEACFPPAEDLPENLTVAEFRRSYGGVGSRTYRNAVARIDAFLARCAALAADPISRKR